MISQICHLQSSTPFETFSIELTNGRVIQIHDRHSVATTIGTRLEEGMIGILDSDGIFDVINAKAVATVSVGVLPKVKERLDRRMKRAKKTFGGEGKEAHIIGS
jgi:hypothetical protein